MAHPDADREIRVGAALITSAEVYGDFVYANGSDMKLHAYRAEDGVEVWSSEGGQFVNDLLVTSKFVYASDGATLYLFDRVTGKRYAALGHPRQSYDYAFTSAPATDAGSIYITLNEGAWSFFEP